MSRMSWWTAADAAELDVLVFEFVRVHALHVPGCEECPQRGPWCKRLRDSFDAVEEWRDGRALRSRAAWLRGQELERERIPARVHVFDQDGEVVEYELGTLAEAAA